jgi:hypothetical protein
LNSLADTVPTEESQDLRSQAQQILEAGQIFRGLTEIHQDLANRGAVVGEGENLRLFHLGHPFEQADYSDELWTYALLGAQLKSLALACSLPNCDPVLLKAAQALAPDPGTAASDSGVPAPDSFTLSLFSQRYSADGAVLQALGLNLKDWNPQNFSNHYRAQERALIFPEVFPNGSAILTIEGWDERASNLRALPLFYIFQEAQGIFSHLQTRPQVAVVKDLREIRFQPYQGLKTLALFDQLPGGVRLTLTALYPPDHLGGVDAFRQSLLQQIDSALENFELSNQPTASLE